MQGHIHKHARKHRLNKHANLSKLKLFFFFFFLIGNRSFQTFKKKRWNNISKNNNNNSKPLTACSFISPVIQCAKKSCCVKIQDFLHQVAWLWVEETYYQKRKQKSLYLLSAAEFHSVSMVIRDVLHPHHPIETYSPIASVRNWNHWCYL